MKKLATTITISLITIGFSFSAQAGITDRLANNFDWSESKKELQERREKQKAIHDFLHRNDYKYKYYNPDYDDGYDDGYYDGYYNGRNDGYYDHYNN